ncbi:MAG: hypothetical protein AAF790_06255 [Planctomycetota bacterium]
MPTTPTPAELEAFLDESLPPERMAAIEDALRGGDATLSARLAEVRGRRDAGLHSLGAVWRSRRLTCPTREQLGSYLLGVLDPGHADYVRFHLEVIACRPCRASLADLQSRQSTASDDAQQAEGRRQRYFQSSVGRLRDAEDA